MAVLRNALGRVLAGEVRVCRSGFGRLRGLIGRPPPAEGEALFIPHCRAVHTCFMRYPIDVCFIAASGRVTDLHPAVRPWSAANTLHGDHVLEFRAGEMERVGIRSGDRLDLASLLGEGTS